MPKIETIGDHSDPAKWANRKESREATGFNLPYIRDHNRGDCGKGEEVAPSNPGRMPRHGPEHGEQEGSGSGSVMQKASAARSRLGPAGNKHCEPRSAQELECASVGAVVGPYKSTVVIVRQDRHLDGRSESTNDAQAETDTTPPRPT